jgi:alkylation response protein AidB-like acyl-CoA dehydrogenase
MSAAERYADLPLDEGRRAIVDLAATLADERLAPRAAEIDREARNPHENYADLRDSGIHVMCVPTRFGGPGHDYATYMMVSAELARGCGATALSFNMHASTTLWIGDMLDALGLSDAQREELEQLRMLHYANIVNDGALYAQTFSEGNMAASGKAPFGTSARKVEGGWLLNGRKIFASLSGAATHYGILATEEGIAASRENTLYIAVPDGTEGFSVVGDWDPLGMRGTVSRTLLLKDVFVPDEAQLMPRGTYHLAARHVPHMFMTLSATYMGVAQGAYDFTVAYLRGEVPGTRPSRMHPVKQQTVAQMALQLEQMRALWLRAIGEFGPDPSLAARQRAYAAQYTVMEGVVDICRLAIRTCGGRSMLKSLPLERMYRDARCGALMFPWSAEICLERLGREALYKPGESDD